MDREKLKKKLAEIKAKILKLQAKEEILEEQLAELEDIEKTTPPASGDPKKDPDPDPAPNNEPSDPEPKPEKTERELELEKQLAEANAKAKEVEEKWNKTNHQPKPKVERRAGWGKE